MPIYTGPGMGTSGGISAGELLLSRFKGRALKLCVRLGIVMSALAFLPALVGTSDRGRRLAAAGLLLVCWAAAEHYRKRSSWVPDVLEDRRWVLAAAAFTALPYAIDGHAQSNAFMGIAPLAGVAAVTCRRREVIGYAAISIAAYVVGVTIGAGGMGALGGAEHPFDAAQQVAGISACCGLFAFGVLGFRRFIEQIPFATVETGHDQEGDRAEQPPSLTNRQRQILGLLAQGQSRSEIAEGLFISKATVRTHINNAKDRLDVSSQEEAVAIYLEKHK
jgi:DNA-binding CsgD family transcriptional regulator